MNDMSSCGCSHPLGHRAWPELCAHADIKTSNQDFKVDEILDFEPSGTGEHLYLHLQKDGENTAFVGRALARAFGVSHSAVSYAGMKDRHAVTSQWFSVHLPMVGGSAPVGVELDNLQGEGLEKVTVLRHTRHLKKLRRGQIDRNRFVITLRALDAKPVLIEKRLNLIAEQGFPNYFGEQRFGSDNMRAALQWMEVRRSRKISGFKKALYISVLRSFLFNRVLSARIHHKSWNRLISGESEDAGLPTGPLWGRGRFLNDREARDIERSAIESYGQITDALEHVGLMKEQRNLVAVPQDMEWDISNDTLRLSFALSKGEYATSMLREVVEIRDANPYANQNANTVVEKV